MNVPDTDRSLCVERQTPEGLRLRIHGATGRPTLVYLPGLHGDWTLGAGLRTLLKDRVQFVEFAYPRLTTWEMADYAREIEPLLTANAIHRGWLVGESFGSQVAWALLAWREAKRRQGQPGFEPQGLILAGGFVRYPLMSAVRLGHWLHQAMPASLLFFYLRAYVALVKRRHRRFPERRASMDEFLANRAAAGDRACLEHRYELIQRHDPRPLAQQTTLPVYYLTGFWDVIVPWPFIQPWLKKNCPGYRGWRLVWNADHAVFATQPRTAAAQILQWISEKGSTANERE